MKNLSEFVVDYLKKEGAVSVGISTIETLAGGPPSTDITYIMPEAKSAISFAIPIEQDLIPGYLSKKDRLSMEKEYLQKNALATGISFGLSAFLNQLNIPSKGVCSNEVYRRDKHKASEMKPDLSHRYLAAVSGVGHFGISGNIIVKDYGASVILGTTVTTAIIEPTPPLPTEENYCDDCRICIRACVSDFMTSSKKSSITIGKEIFSYIKRRLYWRCGLVFSGFTGLHHSGQWSTWSPGRFKVPKHDFKLPLVASKWYKLFVQWPLIKGGHRYILFKAPLTLTCANCIFLCHPDKEIRQKRYEMLINSGVVIQKSDGSLDAVTPKVAESYYKELDCETKKLYGAK
ncbi:epoxyqueuosine reductase [Elusimicrobiota bacterium]